MKNRTSPQSRQYFTTRIKVWLLALAAGSFTLPAVYALKPESELPVYQTEEIAAPKLDTRVREQAEKSGVMIRKYLPQPPEKFRRTIKLGAKVQTEGSAEQVTDFLSAVGSRGDFHDISSLSIAVDRRNPELMRAALVVNAWYAKNERVARKTKKWRRSLGSNSSPIEIYAACSAFLEGETARFTSFIIEKNSIRIAGEAANSSVANRFGGRLFRADEFTDRDWTWEMRPTHNARAKDGSVQFAIVGNLKAAAEPKSNRKKSEAN